jgi:hypothetical protein
LLYICNTKKEIIITDMKATVYRLIANNEENTEILMNSYEMPTMTDVDVNEYRGFDIILHTYEVELSQETILELTGNDVEELEYTSIEDIATEISADDLMDYIDEEGIDTADESILEEIDRLNEKSNELINDVMQELASRLNKNYFKKYDFINGKSIRIANHTHNPMNGKCDINVVIAEKDLTRSRFATAVEDLTFDNNATVSEIVEAILLEANN